MGKNIMSPRLAIIGIVIGVVGVIGTYYQIFGQEVVWVVLIVLGFASAISYLWKWIDEIRRVVKTFGQRWSLEDGQLIIGNTVNVALRAKTVQQILNIFRKTTEQDFDKIIKEAGKRMGESFTDDLKKELTLLGFRVIVKSGKNPKLLKEKLRLWTKYDSTTGMGAFEIDEVEITVDGLQGHILVKNSFLAHDRQSEFPSCILIEGYIEGIIRKLLGINITAKEVECSAVTSSEYCKFEIIQKQ